VPVLAADGSTVIDVIPKTTIPGVEPVAIEPPSAPVGDERRFSWVLQSTSSAVFTDLSMSDAIHGFASAELGQVYRTTNGTSWTPVLNQGFPYYWYGVHAFDASTAVITGFNNTSGEGIARWTHDGGVTWSAVVTIDPNGWLTINQFADRQHGVTTNIGGGTTFVTTNGGAGAGDWTEVLADPSGGWFAGNVTFLPQNLYVYLCGISFCRSVDGGLSYTCRPSIDPVFDGGVSFPDTTHGWTGGGQISAPVQGWVHRTTDGGQTWSGRILNPPYPIRVLLFFNESVGFAAGGNYFQSAGGIWSTTDGGTNWNLDLNTGVEMKGLDWARVSEDSVDVWCAGSAPGVGRIYRTRIYLPGEVIATPPVTGQAGAVDVVASPNPFNPAVRFTITTEHALHHAALLVLDAQGRFVRRIDVGQVSPAPSVIEWDGRDLADRPVASGVYRYRLIHDGGRTATRSIVLLK
jgi:photosystem II stability/assembly factor-like uncharacterized protein